MAAGRVSQYAESLGCSDNVAGESPQREEFVYDEPVTENDTLHLSL